MSIPLKAAPVLAAALMLGACNTVNPIVYRDPIPPPPPGYRVVCSSFPLIVTYHYISDCTPVGPPVRERRMTVRAKG